MAHQADFFTRIADALAFVIAEHRNPIEPGGGIALTGLTTTCLMAAAVAEIRTALAGTRDE